MSRFQPVLWGVLAGLVIVFLAFILPDQSKKHDWNGEQFAAVCDYLGGEVVDINGDKCVKNNGTNYTVLLTKADWLKEKNK